MGYATLQDLVDRFGEDELIQLTDRTNRPASTIVAAVAQLHLDDADAIIDGYLAKLYTLPLSVVPGSVTKTACDLARYFLHGKAAEKDGAVATNYRNAVKWLESVATGVVVLDAAGVAPAAQGGSSVRVNEPDRVFSRDSLRVL